MAKIQRGNNASKRAGGITGKGFVKGDPRINRKGRPRNFDEIRELARNIGDEQLPGSTMTRIEAKFRMLLASKNPKDTELFLHYAYGKVKDEVALAAQVRTDAIELIIDDEGHLQPAHSDGGKTQDVPLAGVRRDTA